MEQDLLLPEERLVLELLAQAWNEFTKLYQVHPWDHAEFMTAIHQAQLIIQARPVKRQEKGK